MLDFHSHLVPGVDDGARDLTDARAALAAMRAEGIREIITTPHFEGSLTLRAGAFEDRLAELDEGWERLDGLARSEFPELGVRRGAEVMLDTPEPDLSDPRLRLGGSAFVLVEFPYLRVPPRSAPVLAGLADEGWIPVVAHPERYVGIANRLGLCDEWRGAGALLQVNHGSMTGRYGREARWAADLLLERGWIDYLASDYHARGPLQIAACRDGLARSGGEEQLRILMDVNPRRLGAGEEPLPASPLRTRRSVWQRIAYAFR
jgi:protein-tyrosine phosphatase